MDLTVWLTLSGQKGDSSKGSKQIKGQGCAHIWDKYHKKRQKKYKKKDKKETNFTKRDKTKRQKGCFSKTAKAAKRLKRGQGYTHVWDKYNKKREEKKTKSQNAAFWRQQRQQTDKRARLCSCFGGKVDLGGNVSVLNMQLPFRKLTLRTI